MQPLAIGPGGQARNSSPVVAYQGSSAVAGGIPDQQASSAASNHFGPDILQTVRSGSIRSTNQRLTNNSDLIVLMDSDLNIDRTRTSRDGRLGFEMSGYVHAYGWSLPVSSVKAIGSSSSPDLMHSSSGSPNISAILGSVSPHMMSESRAQDESNVSLSKLSGLQVPIPQYCRPLTGDSLGMKIWCATALDLSGDDGPPIQRVEAASSSSPIRITEFSSSIANLSSTPTKTNNQQALKMLEREVDQALNRSIREDGRQVATSLSSRISATDLVQSAIPITDDSEDLSTFVWVCSTQHSRSKITIIDIKTRPNEKLDSFYVSTFLYCIKSVPGSKPSDLLGISSPQTSKEEPEIFSLTLNMLKELIASQKRDFYKLVMVDLGAQQKLRSSSRESTSKRESERHSRLEMSFEQEVQQTHSRAVLKDDAEISRILDNNVSDGVATLQKLNDFVAHIQPQTEDIPTEPAQKSNDIDESREVVYYQPISTRLPTVWMGGKDSVLYLHSAIGQWKDCVACLKLRDSILQICHFRGRVFVALADGSLCVFFRDTETKQWDLSQYLIMDIGLMTDATSDSMDPGDVSFTDQRTQNFSQDETLDPGSSPPRAERDQINTSSESPSKDNNPGPALRPRSKVAGIRCLEIANKNLWVGYKNRALIIDPITLKLKHTFNVVPQIDNQIRQLISMKDGVFCCLRSDLVLRLYSSLKPYQHIQNIDIEPVVTRLISPKTFVISHITAMRVAGNTLWIGNAHGIIITIPCKLVPQVSEAPVTEGIEEYEESPGSLSIARFVPKCDISNAQVSKNYILSCDHMSLQPKGKARRLL